MSTPIEMSDFAARVSRPPFWPATDGEQPKPTPDNPIPSRPGPRTTEQRDTEIVGRLTFLLRQIAADAAYYEVPAELRQLIGQAQRIAGGDLPQWQQGRAA